MERAIDSEKFYDFLTDQLVKETGAFSKGVNKGLNIARSALHNEQITPTLPAADVTQVRHGEWIGWHGEKLVGVNDMGEDEYRYYRYNTCSQCGKGSAIKSNYCPNCGAKMDLEN